MFDRLTEIRQSQSRQLQAEFNDLKNSLVIYSRGSTSTEAIQAFIAGFDQLGNATIDPAQQQSIVDYYDNFIKDEKAQTGDRRRSQRAAADVERAEVPAGQLHRAVPIRQPTRLDAPVNSTTPATAAPWSAANARFNDFFRQIVNRFEFEDVLLLDTRGNVVYTAYKDVDLGTNILTGRTAAISCAVPIEKALASNSVDYVGLTDFGIISPPTNRRRGWSPRSGRTGHIEGVMALQFPITKINRLMTFDKQWEESGMGETGETFIVGPDDLMRSDSRLFLENPETVQARRDRTRDAARRRR